MRHRERNWVVVDQCTSCGGLFLDRGELSALAAAERAYYAEPAAQGPPPLFDGRRYDDSSYGENRPGRLDDSRSYSDDDRHSGGRMKARASSFLESLFED